MEHPPLSTTASVAGVAMTVNHTAPASTSASNNAASSTCSSVPRPEGIPDILLDGDRLNMLLEIICADYITASYASRENGKKVILKALEKLYLSVNATAPKLPTKQEIAAFGDRAKIFYEELMRDFATRRQQQQSEATSTHQDGNHATHLLVHPASPRVMDESLVREVMKPKLVQIVEELCKERDRLLLTSGAAVSNSGSQANGAYNGWGSMRSGYTGHGTSSTNAGAGAVPLPLSTGEIRMEGWLRKKGQHVNLWRERYFMIRSTPNGTHYLCYFRKKGDKEPRGWYFLGPGTTVDEVRESPSKIETKKLFTFRIRHLTHASSEDVEDANNAAPSENSPSMILSGTPSHRSGYDFPLSPDTASGIDHDFDPRASMSSKKASSRRFRNRAAAAAAAATAATAVVLTGGLAGVGIGMVGMGMSAAAAASAAGAGAIIVQNRNKGPIALAAESLETAVWWRNSILECIAQAEEQWKRYLNWYMDKDHEHEDMGATFDDEGQFSTPANSSTLSQQIGIPSTSRPRSGSFGTVPRSIAKTFRTSATFSQETSWKLYDFSSKIRVDVERGHHAGGVKAGSPPPALRTSMKVMASPKKVFEMIMKTNSSFYTCNHVIQEARVLEEHPADHSDVVYWKLFPTFLWPFHVESRDLCLLRYWRKEQDSSYFICFQSTTHASCPSSSENGDVRANIMGGGFIISPRVHAEENFEECWVTLTIQMNPKGWLDYSISRSWYYMHAYGVYFLEMITAITARGGSKTPRPSIAACASTYSTEASGSTSAPSQLIVSEIKFPILEPFRTDLSVRAGLPTKFWSEPDARSFLVRGPQYLSTRAKVPSNQQVLRLVSAELYKANEAIEHIGLSSFVGPGFDHDANGDRTSDNPLIFIINFMLPGPPHHSLVLYFTPEDPEELKKNTVFADICHEFFHGSSNDFRSKRLKLIPRVVQGTWPIREGVGTTPAILGTKIYQKYFLGNNYVEIDYDIGSSTVATGILKLLLGYSRDLIIDLAFVIEAQSPLELPERVLGCARLDCIDLRHATQYSRQTKE